MKFESKTITISAENDPDLYLLLEKIKNDDYLVKRLLSYLSSLRK